MNSEKNFPEIIDEILKKDNRYEPEAYNFVLLSLNYTNQSLGIEGHVSGGQLLDGLKDYAIDQYGPLALTVLEHWKVRNCQDIGNIVFNLVEAGLLGKNEKDSYEDFKHGFDFKDVFGKSF